MAKEKITNKDIKTRIDSLLEEINAIPDEKRKQEILRDFYESLK